MIQKKKMRLTKDFNVNHQKEEEVKFELRTLFFSPEKDCSEITVCFLILPILLIHHYSHQVCIITSAIFPPLYRVLFFLQELGYARKQR